MKAIPGAAGAVTGGVSCCSPVAGQQLTPEQAERFGRMLKVLADPSRLRLISTMVSMPGFAACECELTGALGLSQPTISHHLAALRRAGLIERAGDEQSCEGDATRARCVYFRPVLEALEAVGKALTPPRQAE